MYTSVCLTEIFGLYVYDDQHLEVQKKRLCQNELNQSKLMSLNMQINKRKNQISYIPDWYSTAWWARWYFSRTRSQSCHGPGTTLFLVILTKWDWGKKVLTQWVKVYIHFWPFRSILCWSSNNTWVKTWFYVYFFILNWYTTMIA